MTTFLLSTIGKRGYIADYLRDADPDVRIVATGHDPYTPGFRHVDSAALVPSIWDPAYPSAVLDVVEREGVDAILTFADPDTVVMADLRAELTDRGVACFFNGPVTAERCFDKLKTAEWAASAGFPHPRTVASWEEARDVLGGSFVAKPRTGSASSGVLFIRPDEDSSVLDPEVTYIFQERISGVEVNLEMLGDLEGRPIGLSTWRKHRSRHGETELAITFRDEALLEYATALSTAVGMVGPCDVDVMVVDGVNHLVEFNARFGGGYPTSHLAGARFPELLLAMARGEQPELSVTFEPDIFMMKSLQPFGGRVSEREAVLHLPTS